MAQHKVERFIFMPITHMWKAYATCRQYSYI